MLRASRDRLAAGHVRHNSALASSSLYRWKRTCCGSGTSRYTRPFDGYCPAPRRPLSSEMLCSSSSTVPHRRLLELARRYVHSHRHLQTCRTSLLQPVRSIRQARGGGVLGAVAASSGGHLTSNAVEMVTTETRRGAAISPWILRTIVMGVLGLGYTGFHFFLRSIRAQKIWIKARLMKPKLIARSIGLYPAFDRPSETAVLRNYLIHPPAGTS